MKRLGLANISTAFIVFFALSKVFAASGEQPISLENALVNTEDATSCPPTNVDTFNICLGDTIYDTLAFYFQDLSDTAIDLKIKNGPGHLVVEKSDSLYGYFNFVPAAAGKYTVTFLLIGPNYDSTAIKYQYVIFANQPPVIACPNLETFYTCEPDSFYFTVDATDPEQDSIAFNILSGNATVEGRTVCVTSDVSANFDVVIEAVDDCGNTDTCVVLVTINVNHPPYVNMAEDFSTTLCQPETICFSATADDLDFDIANVSVNQGYYNDATDKFCFYADTSGLYTLILTAIDTCGAIDSDTTLVTVTLNQPPVVNLGNDFSFYLCGATDVCFNAPITDDNLATVYTNYGNYDTLTGQICFTPDTTGSYTIALTAIDACGEYAYDTVVVTVTGGAPAYVNLGADFSTSLCTPSEVCVNVQTIGGYKSITTTLGVYNAYTGQVCFVPDTPGVYSLIVEVTDSCDYVAADTVNITVNLNRPPMVNGMRDTTLYLCYPQEVCIPVNVLDPDGDIETISANYNGQYADGAVCFVPYDSGQYQLIVTATDSCGHTAADTATVVIQTDQGISIQYPNDTTIFTCQQVDTFCLPISGIPENATVAVTGINTWYDSLTGTICFWSECSNTNRITAYISTPCNTYVREFTVTVECNSAPLVILPPDTSLSECVASNICLPVGISDANNNLSNIIVQGASFNPITSRVCFTSDTAGTYLIQVTAVDSCGATDSDSIAVTVKFGNPPYTNYVPTDTLFIQCTPEEICLPIEVGDVDGNLDTVIASFGFFDIQISLLCFTPDTVGHYCIQVIAYDLCGLTDTADVCVTVVARDSVQIDCPDSLAPIDIALCASGPVCWPLNITGANFQVQTSNGIWVNGNLCFSADTSGLYNIEVIASGQCNSDTCSIAFNVQISQGVSISGPADTAVLLCGPDTLCLPYGISSNVDTVTVTPPAYLSGQEVCVPLLQPNDYVITMIASGTCGTDTSVFTVTAQFNSPPTVDAGADTTFVQCGLNKVCIPFTVSDVDNNVVSITTIPLGVIDSNQICLTPPSFGTYDIIIAALDECGASDSDTVAVTVNYGDTVNIACPQAVLFDTICGPDTIRIYAPITPDNAVITVLPNGYYDQLTDEVCIPVDRSGAINVTIIAESPCGSDTCEFTLNVALAEPPTISCPILIDTTLCLAGSATLCFPATVSGTVSQISVSPIGTYSNGSICLPVDSAGTYQIEIAAEGICGVDTCTITIQVQEKVDCNVCVRLSIDGGDCIPVGRTQNVNLRIETNNSIGGFNLLVSYDASAMVFMSATITGTQIDGWEYFNYNPSLGMIRFVGLAETANGPYHPPDSTLTPNGILIVSRFQVSNNQNIGGYFLPISFVWQDCGDNAFSDPTGNDLYMDLRIFNAETTLVWDEMDDITYPESTRPSGVGAPDSCLVGGGFGKPAPTRCIEFINGGICIIPAESLDTRGDINLNGIPYEIADAVVFTNFFIYGFTAFTINVDAQVAATDVNADGLTLSVGDLVYLIRIIVGDADPIPKVIPYPEELTVSTDRDTNAISISTEAVSTIGAALLVYDIDGELVLREPQLTSDAKGMDLMYAIGNSQLRLLIYNIGSNMISTGLNRIVEIPCHGAGQLNLTDAEIVDYQGRPYIVAPKKSELPSGFFLNQNYPNPFNPATTISFFLPQPTEWKLEIFNITGGLVREFRGWNETGPASVEWDGRNTNGLPAASGVYLYRLQAAGYSATKKMVLLK